MSERRYSVEEANVALAEIAPLLERLRDAQRVMERRGDEVLGAVPTNGGGGAGKEYLEASSAASASLADLQRRDVIVRDPEAGLIDFPSERDGQEIFLCWRLGEERVAWWHPADSGFADRRPV